MAVDGVTSKYTSYQVPEVLNVRNDGLPVSKTLTAGADLLRLVVVHLLADHADLLIELAFPVDIDLPVLCNDTVPDRHVP